MSAAFAHALDVASQVLTFMFLAEVVLKLLGLGTWGFASDPFNVFDLVVVATGVLELAMTVGGPGRGSSDDQNDAATCCLLAHHPQ